MKLIVSDGGKGLLPALEEVYPLVPKQRCWFHKMQNVANKVRKKDRPACVQQLRGVYQAANRREAVECFRDWARKWRGEYPRAVERVERDLDTLLNFYACPPEHRKMVRTTNAIERCIREVRRRTNSIGARLEDDSIEIIVYAVFQDLNQRRARHVCHEFKTQHKVA